MENTFLLVLALVCAVVNWLASDRKWALLIYLTKPATMLLLIGWLASNVSLSGGGLWFILGAVFCLAGDVFLMLPGDWFIFGLASFLTGHLLYIVGFNALPAVLDGSGWLYAVLIVAILAFASWQIFRRLNQGLAARQTPALRLPVLLYDLTISVMVLSAWLCPLRPGWERTPAILGMAGALLFYLSDTTLAFDRFVRPIPHARLLVMSTYHLGQLGILLAAGMTFLR